MSHVFPMSNDFSYIKTIKKVRWSTSVVIPLTKELSIDSPISVSLTNKGDYLRRIWLKVLLPKVTILTKQLKSYYQPNDYNSIRMRWIHNLEHNLIDHIDLFYNGLPLATFNNYFLNIWSVLVVSKEKEKQYSNLLGDLDKSKDPLFTICNSEHAYCQLLPTTLFIPIPILHFLNTGISLFTSRLPFNDIRVKIYFTDLNKLIKVDGHIDGPKEHDFIDLDGDFPVRKVFPDTKILTQVLSEYVIIGKEEYNRTELSLKYYHSNQAINVTCSISNVKRDPRIFHIYKPMLFNILKNKVTLLGLRTNFIRYICGVINVYL